MGGSTSFRNSARADASTLTAEGGANGGLGGVIQFFDTSSGGTARVILGGIGAEAAELFINSGPAMGIGSIEGAGIVTLASNLAVGTNNLNTQFDGLIRRGGGLLGGLLTKVGSGTLTLSGNNTYAGGTVVKLGTLQVTNPNGQGTGAGTVGVDPFGRLLFTDSARAGGGEITNLGSGTVFAAGLTRFEDFASAGNVGLVDQTGSNGGAGGITEFAGNSTAAMARIVDQPGTLEGIQQCPGRHHAFHRRCHGRQRNGAKSWRRRREWRQTAFSGRATAGEASILNGGATTTRGGSGRITFPNEATAGHATITLRAGATAVGQGGSATFADSSTAGTARFTLDGTTFPNAGGG